MEAGRQGPGFISRHARGAEPRRDLATRDRRVMGRDCNGPVTNALGWVFFAIICIAALAAPILLAVTGMGSY